MRETDEHRTFNIEHRTSKCRISFDIGCSMLNVRRFLAFLSVLVSIHTFAQPLPKLILLTQSKGFVHDVVKHPDGGPSVVQKTFASIAEKSTLFELETTEDASILTPEKLKQTRIVVFYTTGDLPMDL